MPNCENCIHKYVCKNYPVDSLPPNIRQTIFKKLDEECKEFINNADANLVVHGEWMPERAISLKLTAYRCTECRNIYTAMTRYCPACGAKMDGGNKMSTGNETLF